MNAQVKWTAKFPAIVLGTISLLWAGLAARHGKTIAGVVLIILGLLFVTYSFGIKDWCELHEGAWGGTWGEMSFKGTLGECIRNKSWFSF